MPTLVCSPLKPAEWRGAPAYSIWRFQTDFCVHNPGRFFKLGANSAGNSESRTAVAMPSRATTRRALEDLHQASVSEDNRNLSISKDARKISSRRNSKADIIKDLKKFCSRRFFSCMLGVRGEESMLCDALNHRFSCRAARVCKDAKEMESEQVITCLLSLCLCEN